MPRGVGRAPFNARQEENLRIWGYPYVFEAFRFHVTLAGPCNADTRARLRPALEEAAAPMLDESFVLDAISVVEQPDRSAPFRVAARYPLSAGTGARF